jgi:hypothetical protein
MSAVKNINTVDTNKPNQYDEKVKLIKTDGYSIMPNKFAQNKSLSIESIGLGTYLNSLPNDWTPRRTHLQKHFGFGDHVWRKIAKELREEGYLKLEKGGDGGGCDLVFDINGSFRHVENQRVATPDALITDASKSDASKINAHTKYTSVQNTNNKTTTVTTETLGDKVVVDLVKRMKEEAGVTDRDAQHYLEIHTPEKIAEKLSMLKNTKAEKPAAWLRTALRDNFQPTKPKPLAIVGSVVDTAQSKHLEESALQQMEARHKEYQASKTEDQIRIEESLMKRFSSRKHGGHSALI